MPRITLFELTVTKDSILVLSLGKIKISRDAMMRYDPQNVAK